MRHVLLHTISLSFYVISYYQLLFNIDFYCVNNGNDNDIHNNTFSFPYLLRVFWHLGYSVFFKIKIKDYNLIRLLAKNR